MREDIIIIGQGLAGSILALQSIERGKRVFIIDEGKINTSSKIAAGLVNPITGRRFVKSWKFDELSAYARNFYRDMEARFGEHFIFDLPLIRVVEDRRFVDDIEAKTMDEHYGKFIQRTEVPKQSYIADSPLTYKVNHAFRVDISNLIEACRKYFEKIGCFLESNFKFDRLNVQEGHIEYENRKASTIVFCEGAAGRNNPFFDYLPFQPTKGELFELKQDHLLHFAYKHDLALIPKDSDILWCGALNFWEFTDDKPSNEGEMILLQKLKKFYRPTPFIHRHLAAIRPTVKDRRPLIGQHPSLKRLYIFNGLGTKGTLLAPYFGNQLLDLIENNEPLLKEVDIGRFADLQNAK